MQLNYESKSNRPENDDDAYHGIVSSSKKMGALKQYDSCKTQKVDPMSHHPLIDQVQHSQNSKLI